MREIVTAAIGTKFSARWGEQMVEMVSKIVTSCLDSTGGRECDEWRVWGSQCIYCYYNCCYYYYITVTSFHNPAVVSCLPFLSPHYSDLSSSLTHNCVFRLLTSLLSPLSPSLLFSPGHYCGEEGSDKKGGLHWSGCQAVRAYREDPWRRAIGLLCARRCHVQQRYDTLLLGNTTLSFIFVVVIWYCAL